ncbi:MAG: hypothetical protein WB869_16750 [Candidatus Acidiferrales bacterium]
MVAKKADLFLFGFEVFTIKMGQNEIQYSNAALDEIDFMIAPVADVRAVDLTVEPVGEKMVKRPALWKTVCPGMLVGVKFAPEVCGAVAPMRTREGQELAGDKIPRMSRNDIEKASFHFGVTESLQACEVRRGDIHNVRIRAVISRLSRTRRNHEASSERP